ncbi:external NADH-ubiquinone oxidoreductase 1, mitochondrial-like [Lytechinus variegatus]|uniref:external NADH-ubiquinone oxidoreductase 1, mitochondrial-like n=1 Tax=Lytechinus variegatus TaxID=7654 RepID=UPI001BB1D8D1|nr:external NADH-ubiquinone oxidoreductase 1, mitochondrial-like [Lytechinus variegatus]
MEKYATCLQKLLKMHSGFRGQNCISLSTWLRPVIPRSHQQIHTGRMLSRSSLHCRSCCSVTKFQRGRITRSQSLRKSSTPSSYSAAADPSLAPSTVTQASKVSRPGSRQKLVILGTGWGSYSVLKNIDKSLYDVVVVSPRNHFLFTPLLASTTVGTLEFRSIIEPVRNTGFRQSDHFHLAEAVKLDTKKKADFKAR